MTRTRGIGLENDLPWPKDKYKADLKRFQKMTTNHPVIMGYNTWKSIGRPLPNRLNIVITTKKLTNEENVVYVGDLNRALKRASMAAGFDTSKVYIIGGGQVYEQAINLANRLEITIVEGFFPADTYFPIVWGDVWEQTNLTIENDLAFYTYKRRKTEWDPDFS